jgi:biotin synthase
VYGVQDTGRNALAETAVYAKIDAAAGKLLSGSVLSKNEIVELLGMDARSDECGYLRKKADECGRIITGNKAYLWGAVGVDYASCAASCSFCSFGGEWGLVKTEKIYTLPEIIAQVREYVNAGVHFIVLRTTQYYSLETLAGFVQAVRKEVRGSYEVIVNAGDFDVRTANCLYESGVNGVYHAIRLREGIDTPFAPEHRLNTLSAVKSSPLSLIHLVEPAGPEHSYEEIADRFLCAVAYGAYISGIMARVPVKGTPLGDIPQLDSEEIAKITAVLRLAGGSSVRHICVHPASEPAIQSGANVVVVETGAIPRDGILIPGKWMDFDAHSAKKLFEENGFTIS